MAYRSIFKASNWLLDPLVLTVKPVRRLTGILELPGIFGDVEEEWSLRGFGRRHLGIIKIATPHVEPNIPVSPYLFRELSPTALVPQHDMILSSIVLGSFSETWWEEVFVFKGGFIGKIVRSA